MKAICSLISVLVLLAVLATPQTMKRPLNSNTVQGQDRDVTVARRLRLAREYLLLAGINAPPTLDPSELPQLRTVLLEWITIGESGPSSDFAQQQSIEPGSDVSYLKTLTDRGLVQLLRPTIPGRFARMFQVVEKQQQLPGTIVATPAGSSDKPQPVHNPQGYLFSHQLATKPSELFLSSADLLSIYKTYGKFFPDNQKPADDQLDKHLHECSGSDRFQCLARNRKKDLWSRLFSGFTLTFGAAQRNHFQQGTLFNSQTFPDLDYTFTGQLDFDPTSLFVTSTDWTNAAGSLISLKRPDLAKIELQKLCQGYKWSGVSLDGASLKTLTITNELLGCIKSLDRRLGTPAHVWAFLIPTVMVKKESQFDFVKNNGGLLIPAPFPQPTLNTFSFTFDLRRLVPSIKERTDAFSAFIDTFNAAKPKPTGGSTATTSMPDVDAKYQVVSDYLDLVNDPGILADDEHFRNLQAEMKIFILKHQLAITQQARSRSN
jgi:hypothetical protein